MKEKRVLFTGGIIKKRKEKRVYLFKVLFYEEYKVEKRIISGTTQLKYC